MLRNQGDDAALRSLNFSGTGENWHVSLVGIDSGGHRVLVRSMDNASTVALTQRDLRGFAGYDTIVAVISHDDPTEADAAGAQYAPYSLTTNGGTAHGG